MVLKILKFPDPRLQEKSLEVKDITSEMEPFIKNMFETMYAAKGIGLSAPQVARLERIVVIDTTPIYESPEGQRYTEAEMTELEKKIPQPLTLINPKIIQSRGATTYQEGCLSVPTYFETVHRAEWIKFEYLDLKGQSHCYETDGLLSICIQHEIDHLDGKLFIDRLSIIKSSRIKSKIKKLGYDLNKKPGGASI